MNKYIHTLKTSINKQIFFGFNFFFLNKKKKQFANNTYFAYTCAFVCINLYAKMLIFRPDDKRTRNMNLRCDGDAGRAATNDDHRPFYRKFIVSHEKTHINIVCVCVQREQHSKL